MVAAAVAERESAGAWQAGVKEARSGDAEEPKGLRDAYRARRIRPGQLTGPSKRLVQLAIAQIMLVAVLMAAQKVHQPQVNSDVSGAAGGTFTVPLVVLIVMVMSVRSRSGSGWPGPCEFARRGHPDRRAGQPGRWPTCRSRAFVSVAPPSTRTCPTLDCAGRSFGTLAVFWVWLGGTTAAAWHARRKRPAVSSRSRTASHGIRGSSVSRWPACWPTARWSSRSGCCTRRLAWPQPVPARCSRGSRGPGDPATHILGPRGPAGQHGPAGMGRDRRPVDRGRN